MYFTANNQSIDIQRTTENYDFKQSFEGKWLKGLYFKMLNNQEQLDQFVNTRNDKGPIEFVCIGFSLLKCRLL